MKHLILPSLLLLLKSVTAQFVGIGTNAPAARLHVHNGSVVFTLPGNLPETAGPAPVNGPGVRMMWYADKAAFRVGEVTGNIWDAATVGKYSFAAGKNAAALGESGFAVGENAAATSLYGIGLGAATYAFGESAVAIGTGAKSEGKGNLAIGNGAQALEGTEIVALGRMARAENNASLALGHTAFANGVAAASLGYLAKALAQQTLAIGVESIAMFDSSMAIGHKAFASEAGSMSIGLATKATGSLATALGYKSIATAFRSTAIGDSAIALGQSAVSLGSYTTALGQYSTAMGRGTAANGQYSTAMGQSTTANAFGSLVIGRFNVLGTPSGTEWIATDPVFVVGNGSNILSRSNALTLLKNGNMTIAGTLTQNSDVRLKKDIRQLDNILEKIQHLSGYRYHWADDLMGNNAQIGLLAQEVETHFPELVHTDEEGKKSVAYGNMIAVLLQALKEQQGIINHYSKKEEVLEARVKILETLVESLVK